MSSGNGGHFVSASKYPRSGTPLPDFRMNCSDNWQAWESGQVPDAEYSNNVLSNNVPKDVMRRHIRTHKVPKPRTLYLELYDHSEI